MDGEEWLSNRRIMNKNLLREDSGNWLDSPVKEAIGTFIQKWKIRADNENFIPNLETEFYRLSIEGYVSIVLVQRIFKLYLYK